jgi:hypothetical protein
MKEKAPMFALFNAIIITLSIILIVSVARFISESTADQMAKSWSGKEVLRLPAEIAIMFPNDKVVIGGTARIALWCILNHESWPKTYEPRDKDFMIFGGKSRVGKGTRDTDYFATSSVAEYFYQIDLISNQIAVFNGCLYTTKSCIETFKKGVVSINTENWRVTRCDQVYTDFLIMRAAVQTGWDLYEEKYHHRHGALKMPPEYIEILKMYKTQEHAFYGDVYREKIEQIKKGNH